jgi:serine/threonine protein kinase
MAEVYKSTHPDLGRDIAVKILHPFHTQVPGFIGRFRLEAQAAASLHHPNIVQVYDFEVTEDGLYYMVMQYINGLSLEEYLSLEKAPLTLIKAFWFLRQIANALQFAHRRGTIHRDVKPANIMLDTRENAYLSDFGLAKIVGVDRQTLSGMSPGTPSYMAPEHISGKSITTAVDIYAMGVILYRMLTNRLPYEGDNLMTIITRTLTEPPTPPREYNPDIPQVVEDIILKAMAENPQERYPDAITLSRVIADALAEVGAEVPEHQGSTPIGVVPLPGLQLENYKVKREFIRDSAGVSRRYFQRYLAHNVALDDLAVLTVLKTPADEDSSFNRRFQQRMDVLARLDHPSLSAITRVDKTPSNQPYVAYEYIPGKALDSEMDEWQKVAKRVPAADALKLIRQIAEPLAVVHDVGIHHNDLRPENIIVREGGSLSLVGLEIPVSPDSSARNDAARVLDYAAPEQLEAGQTDERSNIFSLGVILYELLADHRPILDWDSLDDDHMPQPIRLEAARSGLAAETYQLVGDCIRPLPDDRLATVDEFIQRVDQAAMAERLLQEQAGLLSRQRRRVMTAVPVAAVAVFLLIFGFFQSRANTLDENALTITVPVVEATAVPSQPAQVLAVTEFPSATPVTEASNDLLNAALDTAVRAQASATPTASRTVRVTLTPVKSPTLTPTSTATPACEQPEDWVTYEVKKGDVLFNLALSTGTTVDYLKQINCLSGNVLSIGQEIWLPIFPPTATPTITNTPPPTPRAQQPRPSTTPSRTPPPLPTPTDTFSS